MPTRTSEATWEKDLKSGHGEMIVGKGVYKGPFTFLSRFETGKGTNPEELLAAAHAGCYSMAFSATLSGAGHIPEKIHTAATVHLDAKDGGFAISKVDLVTEGKVPGLDAKKFQEFAEMAKKNCPVSKLFAGAEITLKATLET